MELTSPRLEPIGASDDSKEQSKNQCPNCQILEEDKDLLQSSLFALTTHFAQIQFGLRQISNAPSEDKEKLLESVETVAFRGIHQNLDDNHQDVVKMAKIQRAKQKTLIKTLKSQLADLRVLVEVKVVHQEELEKQLKDNIRDLERFICELKNGNCIKHHQLPKSDLVKNYMLNLLDKTASLMRMFALIQFSNDRHWGDLRAKLELAIINVKRFLTAKEDNGLLLVVRGDLAKGIRDLMQHGTKTAFMDCFSNTPMIHGWDIILNYYHLKSGEDFNASTMQTLSQSFDLQIASASPKNSKRNLLCVIGNIISTHSRYKRSNDSHFRAFICAALNANRLVNWLNLICHCEDLVETCYYPWSYVASTGYEDGLRSLDLLTRYSFNLPVDLDVRKFAMEEGVFM